MTARGPRLPQQAITVAWKIEKMLNARAVNQTVDIVLHICHHN